MHQPVLWIREFYSYLKLALLDEYINKNIIKVNTVQVMEIDSLKKCILQLLPYLLYCRGEGPYNFQIGPGPGPDQKGVAPGGPGPETAPRIYKGVLRHIL